MRVEYLAHACFLLTLSGGTRLLIDPYHPKTGYQAVDHSADYTLITHDHFDHNHLAGVRGRTVTVRGAAPRRCGGARVWGVVGDHGDGPGGTVCFAIEADGVKVVHLGDQCTALEDPNCFGEVDLLLFPSCPRAWEWIEQIRPRIAVPMHYRTPFTSRELFPGMETLEPLKAGGKVELTRESALELEPGEFGGATRVLALNHLLEGRPHYAR